MASTAISHQRIQRYHSKNLYSSGINRTTTTPTTTTTTGGFNDGLNNFSTNNGELSDTQRHEQGQQDIQHNILPGKPLVNSAGVSADPFGNKNVGDPNGASNKGISKAVLAKKYLVYFENNISDGQSETGNNSYNTPPQLGPTKTPMKCVKISTKEFMQCKVCLRDERGVSILAAHERLGECSEFVNPINELIVTPKYFCLISPATYGNLHSYIYSKSALKETEAKSLFKQMVSIVNYCHSKGIILRDLKMGRFVFTDKERTTIKLDSMEDVVILPEPSSEDDSLDDRHGCPNYVSPEKTECVMKSGRKYPGKLSDIWALGISLYAMLAGRYPFVDSDCSRLLQKIRSGKYAMIDGISSSAKSLIHCLLTRNPADRPSCKAVLTHPWFQRCETLQSTPTPIRAETPDRDGFRVKRMRFNDDQVVPGSD